VWGRRTGRRRSYGTVKARRQIEPAQPRMTQRGAGSAGRELELGLLLVLGEDEVGAEGGAALGDEFVDEAGAAVGNEALNLFNWQFFAAKDAFHLEDDAQGAVGLGLA